MAIIKWQEEDTVFALSTGMLRNLKVGETQSGKQYARFSLSYDYRKDEFDESVSKYISCIAWSDLAEYMGQFVDRQENIRLLVCGKLKVNEWKGKQIEQIECDYIAPQPQAEVTVQRKKRDDYDNEIPF